MNKNKIAVEVFNEKAELYQEKYMDLRPYHPSFDRFCDYLHNPQAQVLDLACGPGNITHYLLQGEPNYRILGVDLAPKMIELAQANNPTAEFRVMDALAIDQLSLAFDGVVLGFGLPYFSRENASLLFQKIYQILAPQGILYLSTMIGDYASSAWQTGSDPTKKIFMYYHETAQLKASLAEAGFEVLATEDFPSPYPSAHSEIDLLVFAQKK